MTNYSAGHQAEEIAASYLTALGYKINELNWRTKYCEIDIVAIKGKTAYLVEVKSRSSSAYGSGFDYITPKKLKQMKFAAEMWVSHHQWAGDYQLAAIEVENEKVTNFLTDL